MLYKIDDDSKKSALILIHSFIYLDGKRTESEEASLFKLKEIFNLKDKFDYIMLEDKEDIKEELKKVDKKLHNYLKDILLEINEKNKYDGDTIGKKINPFTKTNKKTWKEFIKKELFD
ncbi:hypothetical protein N5U00_03860 [Aliarcobacter butzleri]|uniref:TerB family tellurite resistance protein n=1 Tax=Aliarcobacter butzleri TaxID=28197 RepID=A0AAW7PRE3_9BACT|nr:hypothetical protein [Aliarcobacter butzleri]MCT7574457.1 hypothetical protein [Aliarcobacter butzleri]MDN5063410.1 hypothetical protein [Aliarcobacter butzleri]MDN5065794.1 hypothetical protein [Aliarcobacter butzleri]